MEIAMDTAGTFKPNRILVWRKVKRHAETARIIGMFPQARVEIVDRQRIAPVPAHGGRHPIVAGKRMLMIGETSSFLRCFDGCLGAGVCCAPYFKLVPISNGCPYFCTYCYLAYIYRDYQPFIKVNINYGRMFEEIRTTTFQTGSAIAFNMGEMLDSLALDHVSLLVERLVPFLSRLPNAHLMLLTKSANIEGLLRVLPNSQTVVSWSLNTQRMIGRFEIGTASLEERIEAARRCQEHGYRIRLRIDPGILYEGWESDYTELIRRSLAVLEPENVTLGMLRLLPGHFALARQAYGNRASALREAGLSEKASDGKLRYPFRQRVEFYRFLTEVIRSLDARMSIGLCRETPDVWSILNHQCDRHQCNCLIGGR
jgi:spore photoproduct lyase